MFESLLFLVIFDLLLWKSGNALVQARVGDQHDDTRASYRRFHWKDFSRPEGSVDAVYDLIDRVLGDSSLKNAFDLSIVKDDHPWFRLEEKRLCMNSSSTTTIAITATSASELTAGLGHYLKEYCNFTLEWSTGGRAGGSHIVIPETWPVLLHDGHDSSSSISVAVQKQRIVPWSYLMNVCTHSYSLVWYDWTAWQSLIDNLALRGINMILALTGQEEIQYQVFSELGVQDEDIRSWFNGPAFLTWSRGQNEYGSGIAGPLPRSFMKSQWHLQREHILPRLRSLGIVGILPAFQGNVPVQIKTLFDDSNITQQGDTGWLDSLDPLFGRIADMWMTRMIQDFGTDHYYQLDGYFNGGTAPWLQQNEPPFDNSRDLSVSLNNKRRINSSSRISSEPPSHNEDWYRRGLAAYSGLSRTDPQAYWMYQGFAFVGWDTDEQASYLKGFIDSAPKGKFIVIDMGYAPEGEFHKWNNASYFGAPFIWTKLYNFGDTDGIRGDLHHLNDAYPNRAMKTESSIAGIGATPEGIDHNPMYFEFLYEQNFRASSTDDLLGHLINVAHKRYGLQERSESVAKAWGNLLESVYSREFSVQDQTAVAHLEPAESASLFENDRKEPTNIMCKIYWSWKHLTQAAKEMDFATEPFLYDLVSWELVEI
jgi:alpha-N-acetylglucosaminidase